MVCHKPYPHALKRVCEIVDLCHTIIFYLDRDFSTSCKVCPKPSSTSKSGFQPKALILSVLKVALVIGVVLPCCASSSGISNTTFLFAFLAISSANWRMEIFDSECATL